MFSTETFFFLKSSYSSLFLTLWRLLSIEISIEKGFERFIWFCSSIFYKFCWIFFRPTYCFTYHRFSNFFRSLFRRRSTWNSLGDWFTSSFVFIILRLTLLTFPFHRLWITSTHFLARSFPVLLLVRHNHGLKFFFCSCGNWFLHCLVEY